MYASGRNAAKRESRAAMATLKGSPGGWKAAVRRWQGYERMILAESDRIKARIVAAGRSALDAEMAKQC